MGKYIMHGWYRQCKDDMDMYYSYRCIQLHILAAKFTEAKPLDNNAQGIRRTIVCICLHKNLQKTAFVYGLKVNHKSYTENHPKNSNDLQNLPTQGWSHIWIRVKMVTKKPPKQ